MRRLALFSCFVALVLGCGKKPAANTDPPDQKPGIPNPGMPNPGGPPITDPNAGKPKDQAKVLVPLGVLKTGLPTSPGERLSVHLSADGSVAAVWSIKQKTTQIWKVGADSKKLQEFSGNVLALSPDGKKYLRAGKEGQNPEIASTETGAATAVLEHRSFNHQTFASVDTLVGLTPGEWLEPKKPGVVLVREFNTATGKMTSEFQISAALLGTNYAFFNHGKELAVGTRKDNKVEFWDLAGKKKSREITLANPPKSGSSSGELPWSQFTVSQDGKWLALTRHSGNRVFDGMTGAELTPADVGDSTASLLPGRGIYLYYKSDFDLKKGGGTPTYFAYDVKKGAVVATLPMAKNSLFHRLSPNGNLVLTENDSGDLTAWDLTQIP